MVLRIQEKLFSGDKVKEFKVALAAFLILFFLIVFTIGAAFLFRGESFQKACEEVQFNNVKLVTYLREAEQRSIQHIEAELDEGKVPVNTPEEIHQSFHPVIYTFRPVNC